MKNCLIVQESVDLFAQIHRVKLFCLSNYFIEKQWFLNCITLLDMSWL